MNPIDHNPAIASLKQISLTKQEKQKLLHNVLLHVDQSHALSDLPAESPYWHVWVWNYSMVRRTVMYLTIFLMMFATMSGGMASAAETSLPGDVLYDFKVNVMEPAGVVLSFGSQAKAKLVAKFAERRLAEAATLAAQGRLDRVKAEEIKVRFEKHAEAFSVLEKKVELNGNPQAAKDAQNNFDESVFKRYVKWIASLPPFGE